MFKRTKSFFRGFLNLLKDPMVIEHYQSLVETERSYHKTDMERVKAQNTQLSKELDFRKALEQEGVGIGSVCCNRQVDNQEYALITIQGISCDAIETDKGKLPQREFLQQLQAGAILTVNAAQVAGDKLLPASCQEITDKMMALGFERSASKKNEILWTASNSYREFNLGGWDSIQAFAESAEAGEIAGILIYPSTEVVAYSDAKELISAYKSDLYYDGPLGVTAKAIKKDPSVIKQIDDVIYDEHCMENPHDIDYYRHKYEEQPDMEFEIE